MLGAGNKDFVLIFHYYMFAVAIVSDIGAYSLEVTYTQACSL
jgi:hypothetical protein